MDLGFVSAILPDLTFREVFQFAEATGYDCVEVMCWPLGHAERRYAGVTHLDVNALDTDSLARIQNRVRSTGVSISSLGYYPNPLSPNAGESEAVVSHIRQVIRAARALGLPQVTSFVGRDWTLSVDDNWPRFKTVWGELIKFAEDHDVKVGIENCPMSFTKDEWPGGKNLATTPAIWRRMFEEIPSENFGLNYDPSHMIWQHMDYLKPMRDFASRIFHVHLKDARLDRQKLDDVGIMAHPNEYHTPKLPGLGDVDWGRFFSVLSDTGYRGAVCVEVEDRAYEETLDLRKRALIQSHDYIRQFIGRHPDA
jgi:sugar phosphate isomerase/epimerase